MVLLSSGGKADCDCDDDIETTVAREAIIQGIPPDLAVAVARVESNFNPNKVGSQGEIGVFQIMPYHQSERVLRDPKINIIEGVYLIKQALMSCKDMGKYAIICFNQGPSKRPKHPEKHPYYLKIKGALG